MQKNEEAQDILNEIVRIIHSLESVDDLQEVVEHLRQKSSVPLPTAIDDITEGGYIVIGQQHNDKFSLIHILANGTNEEIQAAILEYSEETKPPASTEVGLAGGWGKIGPGANDE